MSAQLAQLDFYKICTNITTYIQKCIYKPMIVTFTDSPC